MGERSGLARAGEEACVEGAERRGLRAGVPGCARVRRHRHGASVRWLGSADEK